MNVTIFILITFCFFIASNTAFSDTLKSRLVFGIVNIHPFGCEPNSSAPTCFQNLYIKQLEEKTGLQFSLYAMPLSRAIHALENQKIDLLITFDEPEVRASSNAIIKTFSFDYVLITTNPDFMDVSLKKQHVGILRGVHHLPVSDKLKGMTLHLSNDYEQLFGMLKKQRVEAIIVPAPYLKETLIKAGLGGLKIFQPIGQWRLDLTLFCSKDMCDPLTITKLRSAVEKISQQEAMQMFHYVLLANNLLDKN
ncbi:substrate-binding periplasmic protein [Pseudoalteromonas ostreae]|uniref:substrate-binding periplasmic protein n=1 Tax=Pseudoalteromonas ostreae TaxID=2774154 RepID=UPI001B37E6EF|nr:transporter substrate-binding domain-containing protein [Pseudoalteromonas ostreae]